MITKRLEATAKSFMNYLLKLQEPNIGELPPMEELLSTVHKRCIQQLYDDSAQDIIAALEENPIGVLPVLLNRLVLKVWPYQNYNLVNWNFLLLLFQIN